MAEHEVTRSVHLRILPIAGIQNLIPFMPSSLLLPLVELPSLLRLLCTSSSLHWHSYFFWKPDSVSKVGATWPMIPKKNFKNAKWAQSFPPVFDCWKSVGIFNLNSARGRGPLVVQIQNQHTVLMVLARFRARSGLPKPRRSWMTLRPGSAVTALHAAAAQPLRPRVTVTRERRARLTPLPRRRLQPAAACLEQLAALQRVTLPVV
jgi:hypothetical protein